MKLICENIKNLLRNTIFFIVLVLKILRINTLLGRFENYIAIKLKKKVKNELQYYDYIKTFEMIFEESQSTKSRM